MSNIIKFSDYFKNFNCAEIDASKFVDAMDNDADSSEIEEWLEFELGYRGDMNMNNPLVYEPVNIESMEIEL